MNTFRQSKVSTFLEELENMVKETLEQEVKSTKEKFFENLTPYGYEAYKLAFQIIEFEYILGNDDEETSDNEWKQHFINYHDFIISLLKQGGDTIFNYANVTFTVEHINEVFRQDTRSLEEIMEIVSKLYFEVAFELDEEEVPFCEVCSSESQDELKDKLKAQLNEVAETLKQLTSNKKGIKHFEIEMENANFEIILND